MTEPISEFTLPISYASTDIGTSIIGRRILHYNTVSSTMDIASEFAQSGEKEGLVVIANSQTHGRGRYVRKWISDAGKSLLVSVLFRPRPSYAHEIMPATALAVAEAVQLISSYKVGLKWPNDVMFKGRKLAGILGEGTTTDKGIAMVVGVGLNIDLDSSNSNPDLSSAVGLSDFTNTTIDYWDLLYKFLSALERHRRAISSGYTVVPIWRPLLDTIGSKVTVKFQLSNRNVVDEIEGLAEDVDEEGRLVVKDDSGRRHAFSSGEVSLSEPRPRSDGA